MELDGQPEFIASYGQFNMIELKGTYYGAPHGLGVDWQKARNGYYPEVLVADSFPALRREIIRIMSERGIELDVAKRPHPQKGALGASGAADLSGGTDQRHVRTLDGHDIYFYEGFYYGVPEHYGRLDLKDTDAGQLAGVITDVSSDAVEEEILASRKFQRSVPTAG